MFQYANQPQSISRVLDNGIRLCLSSFKSVVGIAFVSAVISNLPNLFTPTPQAGQAFAPGELQPFLGVMLVTMLMSFVFYNAIILRIDASASDRDISLGTSLLTGLKKLLPVLAGVILYMLAVMLGSILLLIPGIILMISLFFYSMLIVVDNRGIIDSLKTSHHLVWGNWWRTMTVFMVPAALMMVIYIALGFVTGVATSMAGSVEQSAGMPVTVTLLSIAVGTIGGPLFYAIMLAQLHDLKLRKQGLDLEQRLAAG
ncbi:MAG TPA: hypothetical protein ENJ80_03240 [Gammaproteobacteria bacterium]|nr:hypothetical protein [Gammaproteobacteria bacterium]